MPVTVSDLVVYCAASHPTDDSSAAGGAIDATARPLDSELSAASVVELVSDAAGDTQNVTVSGRLAGGEPASETIALTGSTPVVTSNAYERIQSVVLASPAAGNIEVREGVGGTVRHTLAPAEVAARRLFQNAESNPSAARTRYEKVFLRNDNATLSLLNATLTLQTDTAGLYRIALEAAKDGSGSVANRLAAPAGPTFSDDGVVLSIPGDFLAAGEAIGVWIEQALAAGEDPTKASLTLRAEGASV